MLVADGNNIKPNFVVDLWHALLEKVFKVFKLGLWSLLAVSLFHMQQFHIIFACFWQGG